MPCSDTDELIEATVDAEDRLVSYRYVKLSCGHGIGENAMLSDEVLGQQVGTLLAHSLPENPSDFLRRKHWMALQAALSVLTGQRACGPDQPCSVARIDCEGDQTTIRARLNLDLPADQIPPCGDGPCSSGACNRP
jgi:hypothetical protein